MAEWKDVKVGDWDYESFPMTFWNVILVIMRFAFMALAIEAAKRGDA